MTLITQHIQQYEHKSTHTYETKQQLSRLV